MHKARMQPVSFLFKGVIVGCANRKPVELIRGLAFTPAVATKRKPVLIQHISLKASVVLKLAAHKPTSVPFLLKFKQVWNNSF